MGCWYVLWEQGSKNVLSLTVVNMKFMVSAILDAMAVLDTKWYLPSTIGHQHSAIFNMIQPTVPYEKQLGACKTDIV